MREGSFGCGFFYMGQCVLGEWVVGGGVLYGYFREQGLLVGVQEGLEEFHRGCVDYLGDMFKVWPGKNLYNGRKIRGGGVRAAIVRVLGRLWDGRV